MQTQTTDSKQGQPAQAAQHLVSLSEVGSPKMQNAGQVISELARHLNTNREAFLSTLLETLSPKNIALLIEAAQGRKFMEYSSLFPTTVKFSEVRAAEFATAKELPRDWQKSAGAAANLLSDIKSGKVKTLFSADLQTIATGLEVGIKIGKLCESDIKSWQPSYDTDIKNMGWIKKMALKAALSKTLPDGPETACAVALKELGERISLLTDSSRIISNLFGIKNESAANA